MRPLDTLVRVLIRLMSQRIPSHSSEADAVVLLTDPPPVVLASPMGTDSNTGCSMSISFGEKQRIAQDFGRLNAHGSPGRNPWLWTSSAVAAIGE